MLGMLVDLGNEEECIMGRREWLCVCQRGHSMSQASKAGVLPASLIPFSVASWEEIHSHKYYWEIVLFQDDKVHTPVLVLY